MTMRQLISIDRRGIFYYCTAGTDLADTSTLPGLEQHTSPVVCKES